MAAWSSRCVRICAPKHVAQIKKLAREGKYNGVVFHRVIDGFMAQTGDPTGTGSRRHWASCRAEFSKRAACARRGVDGPHQRSEQRRSQFFIVFEDSNFLDSQYTVWGKVTSGHGVRRQDQEGARQSGSVPAPPDKMIKVQVAADAKKGPQTMISAAAFEQQSVPRTLGTVFCRRRRTQLSFVTVWKVLEMTCQRPSTFSKVR